MSGSTAWRRIQRTQREEITVGILISYFIPHHIRVLMLDAKHFMIHRKPFTLYVAFDAELQMPLAWILLPRYELRDGYDRLLRHLTGRNAMISSVVSDWGTGIRVSVADHLPGAVHQRCAFHVLADVLRKMGGQKLLHSAYGKGIWKRVRHVAIGSDTLAEARRSFRVLTLRHPEYARAWLSLSRHLPGIYQFMHYGPLKECRTSNRIENFMGVLEQRLKIFRSMKTPDTCIKIISSLIAEKYQRPTKR